MSGDQSVVDRLRSLPITGRNRRFVQYLIVGLVGISINEGLLFLVSGIGGLSYVIGGTVGRVVSTFVNFVINDRWTWRSYGSIGHRPWAWRATKYGMTRLVGIAIGVVALVAFVELLGLHYLVANVAAIGVGALWGFTASDRFVWQANRDGAVAGDLGWPAVQERLAKVDRPTWSVVAVSAGVFVVFSLLTVQLYRGYWTTGSDFGSYVHMLSTTLDGQGFLIHGKYRVSHPEGSYWGAHFSLTLLLFLPLFAVVRSPMTLLVAKSFLLASSVLALWFVARTHIRSDRLAGAVVLSYALNPFLWSAWLFDFQEQSLLPVLIFGAYYAYARRRYVAFLGLLALVLLTNEFVIFIVIGALSGLVVAAYRGGRLDDERWVLLAGFLFVLFAQVLSGAVMDRFSLYGGIPMASIAGPLKPYVGPRVGVGELLALGVRDPTLIVSALGVNLSDKLLYFVVFLVPVVFLSLNDEVSVGALAPYLLFSWFFAGRSIYYMFGAHYPLYLLPFLYIGAVRVVGRSAISIPSQELLFRLLATVIAINIVTGAVVGFDLNVVPVPTQNEHTETLERAIDGIPADASLLTQNDIYPHVAMRPNANYVVRPDMFHQYQREYGAITPEYVLYDTRLTGRPYDWSRAVQAAFGDRLGTEYGLYQYQDGIYVYKRGYSGRIALIDDDYEFDERFDAGEFELSQENARVVGDEIVGSGAGEGNLWFGPYIELPPGNYTATYRVNVESTGDDPVLRLNVGAGHNSRVVAERTVGATDGWENVTLAFTLDRPTTGVEFRGAQAGGDGTARFEAVRVVLQSTDYETGGSGNGTTAAGGAVPPELWMELNSVPAEDDPSVDANESDADVDSNESESDAETGGSGPAETGGSGVARLAAFPAGLTAGPPPASPARPSRIDSDRAPSAEVSDE
ncbi:GtrA family protein [Haloferax sp. KTX1]|uniref:GtrA family protein n=1 Tax=Haloferax sp. KTX1 TaxID=2600597 RepID=UPI0011DE4C9C|nr:GtrA family protein [Haloferax sp. KTX1]